MKKSLWRWFKEAIEFGKATYYVLDPVGTLQMWFYLIIKEMLQEKLQVNKQRFQEA